MKNRSLPRRLASAGGVVAAIATGALVTAEPAAARSNYGCEWPRVCFYKNSDDASHRRNPTASYQDAGYWQELGSRSRGAYAVYNSRNDDIAQLKFRPPGGPEVVTCVRPNEWVWLNPTEYPMEVRAVRILSRSTCP